MEQKKECLPASYSFRCMTFFASLGVSLAVLGFSFYRLAAGDEDKALWSSLVAAVVGVWLPQPSVPQRPPQTIAGPA